MGTLHKAAALGALVAAAFLGVWQGAHPASAQRATPMPTPDPQTLLRRYGTRFSLPIVDAPVGQAATVALDVASSGWRPTDVMVVELDSPDAAACDTPFDAARVKRVTCVRGIERWHAATVPLSAGAESAVVYSLDPAKVADACTAFEAVRTGRQPLAAWDQQVWMQGHGEPISVKALAQTDNAMTALTGQTSLATGRPAGGRDAARVLRTLPVLWPAASGGRARLLNPSAVCIQANAAVGGSWVDGGCGARVEQRLAVPAFGAALVPPPVAGVSMGSLTLSTPAQQPSGNLQDASVAADQFDTRGWMSINDASMPAASQYGPAFPIAVAPFPGLASELWVTNNHVTATVSIALVMFNGNLAVHATHNDPVPLCPGGTRRYDVQAIAGEIPPTQPRENGPVSAPLLSMRIEATSAQLPTFPPVSGVMVLRGDSGVTAYTGITPPPELQALRGRPGAGGVDVAPITVIPNVKKAVGNARLTTFIGAMVLGNPQAENGIAVDFYDAEGRAVVTGFQRALGNGPAAMFDLREVVARGGDGTPIRLPDGFVGTAVVRGGQNRGMLGVVAIDRPVEPGRDTPRPLADGPAQSPPPDRMASYAGVILPLWPDPDVPTPTLIPTRAPTTPTAPGDTPEPSPTRASATPEITPTTVATPTTTRWRACLPWLTNGSP